MLRPAGGWVITGDDFNSITWVDDVKPVTKKEFDEGFPLVDAWLEKKQAEKEVAKTELLNRLGITQEEAKLLLS
jgi:hypothetical protein